jgi:3-hydroxyacyl-CoA dehydrogenase
LKKAKARAALADLSLKDFICRALREKLRKKRNDDGGAASGWRSVYGRARAADIGKADRAIEAAFERIDLNEWR